MEVTHNTCKNTYSVTPHKFINGGRRCPYCNSSKAEVFINDYLKSNNIKFKTQFSYKDLVGLKDKPLRFDFAILNNDNKVEKLIEYDGEYHYKPIEGEYLLKKQQEHDRRKDEYCKNNSINLIRIPYWEKNNLEYILNNILNINNIKKEGVM